MMLTHSYLWNVMECGSTTRIMADPGGSGLDVAIQHGIRRWVGASFLYGQHDHPVTIIADSIVSWDNYGSFVIKHVPFLLTLYI